MPDTENPEKKEKAPRKAPAKPRRSAKKSDAAPAEAAPQTEAPAKKPAARAPRAAKKPAPAEPQPAAEPKASATPEPSPVAKKEPVAERPHVRRSSNKKAPAAPAADEPAAHPAPEPPAAYPAPETVGGHEPQGNGGHRKRRRRNRRGGDNSQVPAPGRLSQVDPDELVRRAWKIYLGEVTEEGLALMDDKTAAEASRRAFRVAELFLIEAAHHRPAPAPDKPEPTRPGEADQ